MDRLKANGKICFEGYGKGGRRIVSLLLVVICLLVSVSSFSEEGAAWKGFRGVSWGASQEEILQSEKVSPGDIHETDLASGDDWTCIWYDRLRVSRYRADAEYDLINGSLIDAFYIIHSSDEKLDEDYAWLQEALTDLYGSPSDQGMELLQGFFDLHILSDDSVRNSTVWCVGGTVIALYADESSNLNVLYYGKDYHDSQKDSAAGKYDGL